MSTPNLFHRIRKARLFQVLAVYLGVSWGVLQVVGELTDTLRLPEWVGPVAFILLLIGLVIILATAWVQSHPLVDARAAADEIPRSWELDLPEAASALKRGRLPHLTWARATLGGAAAFLLLFGAAGMYVVLSDGRLDLRPAEATAEEAPAGIAVLPFTVRGAALEDWREGMVDLLSTGLDGAAGLRAIASRTVLARWHEAVPDASLADEQLALEVARATGARYALLGSAVAIGPNVRLLADVRSLEDGRSLGQAQAEGPPDEVLSLVDRLAMQTLALILRRQQSDLPDVDVASLTTSSLPALKAYLEGEARFRRGDFEAAATAYERAVAEDSLFALAYHRLGQAYLWSSSINSQLGADARDHALALLERLPEREAMVVRGSAYISQFRPEAVDILREAVRKYPDDAEAWYQLGDAYLHIRATLAGWEEATEALRRAVELAPRFAPYRLHLIDAAFRSAADSALVRRELEAYERLASETPFARRYRLGLDLAWGDAAARQAAIEAAEKEPLATRRQVTFTVANPRFWEVNETLLRQFLESAPRESRVQIQRVILGGLMFARGHAARAWEELQRPTVPESERRNWAYSLEAVLGVRVPALDTLMGSLDVASAGPGQAVHYGAWAADRGKWAAHDAAAGRLAAVADSLFAAGDTLEARRMHQRRRTLDGYALWRRGNPGEAARVLEAEGDLELDWTRWWLATLHYEAGRLRQAERYYRTFLTWEPDPLATYYLGTIYDELGEPARAREALDFFATNWATADPELQPLVEDARRRLARLLPDRAR